MNLDIFTIFTKKLLILFSVRRTDRSNTKFVLSVQGKRIMLDAARPLTSCLHHCQELSWSHNTAATDTSRLTPSAVDGLVGLKCSLSLIHI